MTKQLTTLVSVVSGGSNLLQSICTKTLHINSRDSPTIFYLVSFGLNLPWMMYRRRYSSMMWAMTPILVTGLIVSASSRPSKLGSDQRMLADALGENERVATNSVSSVLGGVELRITPLKVSRKLHTQKIRMPGMGE